MSSPAERKAARDAAKAERKAEREEVKAERKADTAELKASIRAPAGASGPELIDILTSPDTKDIQKQSAIAQFVKDPNLYKEHKELIFKKFDDIVKNGGRINYLLDNVVMDRPKQHYPIDN